MHTAGGAQPEAQRSSAGAQAALLACGLFPTIGLFSPGLLLPQIARAFAATPNAELLTQLIGAISSFFFAVGAPVAGVLIARFGCRAVIGPSLLLLGLAGTAPALLNDLWSMLVTRALVGLAVGGIFTGGLTGIGAMPEQKRAKMFGWYSVVGGAVAIAVFPAIGAMARSGWRLPFTVHLVALVVLPLVFFLPKALGRSAATAPAERRDSGGGLLEPAMLGLLGIAAYAGMSMLLPPMYSPIYLTSLGVTDPRVLAIPVTMSSLLAVFASASYGWLYRWLGVAGVSGACLLVISCVLLLAGTTQSIPLFTIAIAIQGGVLGLIAPNVSAAAMHAAPPEKAGAAMGLANGVMFGSQLLFPFLAAWIRGQAGLAGVFFAFAAAGLLIGLSVLAHMAVGRRRVAPT